MRDRVIFEMSERTTRYARTAYFTTLLVAVLAVFLMMTARGQGPAERCESRRVGEIVALQHDSAGKYYCQRTDYSINQNNKRWRQVLRNQR